MARWSYGITACINSITLVIGLILLGVGSNLAARSHTTCFSLLDMPFLRIGGLLLVVSLLGILGSCCRSCFLMWIYLFLYVVLILSVTIGLVLWITVMIKGDVRLDAGEARKLNDYTVWFQDQVMGLADWPHVRQCLIHKNICSSNGPKNNFFVSNNIKEGCCRPPLVCNESFLTSHDCGAWKNQTDTMCYYCTSCAAGFVSQLTVVWKRLLPGMVVLLIILIVVFIIGCRVFKQNKIDHYKRLYQT